MSLTAAVPASVHTSFSFPREYYFPPFFSRQDNHTIFHAQCQKWCAFILAYCREHRLWKLSLSDAIDSDLFWNKRISKRLSLADAREIIDFMKKEGRADWTSAGVGGTSKLAKDVAWIWWKTPEEWAGAIADWVSGRMEGDAKGERLMDR